MKRTPLVRRTELAHGGSRLSRKAPLRSRPSKRARPKEALATWCEAHINDVCCGRAVHRHHRLMRSQGGGDEASNTLDLCSPCHLFIHGHPAFSYERGFLLHPFDPCCDQWECSCDRGGEA